MIWLNNFSSKEFETFIQDPPNLLNTCSKLHKNNTINSFAQKFLSETLIPMLKEKMNSFDFYHKVKAQYLSKMNITVSEMDIKKFLRCFVYKPSPKMKRQIYKLNDYLPTPFEVEVTSQEDKKVKINPLLWIANSPELSLLNRLCGDKEKFELNEDVLLYLDSFISSLDSEGNQNRLLLSKNPLLDDPFSLFKEAHNAGFYPPQFYAQLSERLQVMIKKETVQDILTLALKAFEKKLVDYCLEFIYSNFEILSCAKRYCRLYLNMPPKIDETTLGFLETTKDFIDSIDLRECPSLDLPSKNEIVFKQVFSLVLKDCNHFIDMSPFFPNVKCLIFEQFDTTQLDLNNQYPTVEMIQLFKAINEEEIPAYKKMYPNLKVIITTLDQVPLNTHNVLVMPYPDHFVCFSNKEYEQLPIDDDIFKLLARRFNDILYIDLGKFTKITTVSIRSIAAFTDRLKTFLLTNETATDHTLQLIGSLFHEIEVFSLSNCQKFTDQGLSSILENCSELKTLSLTGCSQLTDRSFKKLGKFCRKLQYLFLGGCSQITDLTINALASCQSLIGLNLIGCTNFKKEAFFNLLYNNRAIEEIFLNDCTQVDDEWIEHILSKCPSLKVLGVTGCNQIDTSKLIKTIIEKKYIFKYIEIDSIPSKLLDELKEHLPNCKIVLPLRPSDKKKAKIEAE